MANSRWTMPILPRTVLLPQCLQRLQRTAKNRHLPTFCFRKRCKFELIWLKIGARPLRAKAVSTCVDWSSESGGSVRGVLRRFCRVEKRREGGDDADDIAGGDSELDDKGDVNMLEVVLETGESESGFIPADCSRDRRRSTSSDSFPTRELNVRIFYIHDRNQMLILWHELKSFPYLRLQIHSDTRLVSNVSGTCRIIQGRQRLL